MTTRIHLCATLLPTALLLAIPACDEPTFADEAGTTGAEEGDDTDSDDEDDSEESHGAVTSTGGGDLTAMLEPTPQLVGPLHTHPRPQIPALNRLSAVQGRGVHGVHAAAAEQHRRAIAAERVAQCGETRERVGGVDDGERTGHGSTLPRTGGVPRAQDAAACRTCGDELRVPFSCKGRGFCPSCMGRRMAEGAALLVDHMLPAVGYRQWVLSFEGRAAVRLGYDQALLAEVAGALARAVMHDMRWASKERHGLRSVEPLHAGVFMVVQRFRGDLGLFVHLHALATDGAFEEQGGTQRFLPAPTPTAERMTTVLAQVHKVLAAVDGDDDLDMDPAQRTCVQLALAGPRLVAPPEPAASPPLTVSALGMHLHAATTVDGRDRKRLERVCRYLLRPPFAHDAVQALPDGRVRVHFKAPWRSGAAHADMSADKFLARLCALVPPPGFHMTRYFGVFASRHHLRPRILPPSVVPASGQQLALGLDDDDSRGAAAEPSARPCRIGWATLLARVFAVAVAVCRKCGGRMHILDVVTDPGHIARILHGARAPPRPPRVPPPGQLLLLPT